MFWKSKKQKQIEKLTEERDRYLKENQDLLSEKYSWEVTKPIFVNEIISLRKQLKTIGDAQIFSQEEIKRLIILCHPDKHNGKQMAVDLTKRLIKMRDR